ncbi:MAG: enoyl-CoA hydratase/isomerase family protein [Planctomycetes bacterium]|nr:enoyl-CoA hydratase/isomerase family protein [Planctomycetota bacterium]
MSNIAVQIAPDRDLARITLSRPDRLNAFDGPMLRELGRAVRQAAEARARLVVLDGAGGAFSAGGDLAATVGSGSISGHLGALARQFHAVLQSLADLDAVVMTVVGGAAVGGGFSLALAGDLRYATPDARFRLGYARAGLTVDGGISWKLPRLVGLAQAQRIFIEDPDIGAEEARALGLVHDIVAPADVPRRCEKTLENLRQQGRGAVARNRKLLLAGAAAAWSDALDAEAESMRRSAGTADGMEGIRAFVEKRPPKFAP